MKDYTGWDFRMWPLAVVTVFSYEKMYGRFAGTKRIYTGRNNEVTVLTR